MKLPKLYSHFVTAVKMQCDQDDSVRAKGDEDETVVHCLTTNTWRQHEKGDGPGDMFAMVPEQPKGEAIAEEIAKRCNAYDSLKNIVDQIARMQRFNSAEEPDGTKEDGTERWEKRRPEDGEMDSHETLMELILMARKATKGL